MGVGHIGTYLYGKRPEGINITLICYFLFELSLIFCSNSSIWNT